MKFTIYQTGSRAISFMGFDFIKENAGSFSEYFNEYLKMYEGEIEEVENPITQLNSIYELLNLKHPDDYKTRSLSVSDIVQFKEKLYMVDNIGFVQIQDVDEKLLLEKQVLSTFKDLKWD